MSSDQQQLIDPALVCPKCGKHDLIVNKGAEWTDRTPMRRLETRMCAFCDYFETVYFDEEA